MSYVFTSYMSYIIIFSLPKITFATQNMQWFFNLIFTCVFLTKFCSIVNDVATKNSDDRGKIYRMRNYDWTRKKGKGIKIIIRKLIILLIILVQIRLLLRLPEQKKVTETNNIHIKIMENQMIKIYNSLKEADKYIETGKISDIVE